MRQTLSRTKQEARTVLFQKHYDPYNQNIAILLLLALTEISRRMNPYAHTKAYTIWNCIAFIVNWAFDMQWERPLFTNSLAIFVGFQTASADLVARQKMVKRSGLTPTLYYLADFMLHGLPVLVLLSKLLQKEKWSKLQHGSFSLLSQVHFAYSQVGHLDVSEIYVKHDICAAWMGTILAHLLGGAFANCLILKQYRGASALLFTMGLPFLAKKMGISFDFLMSKEDVKREIARERTSSTHFGTTL